MVCVYVFDHAGQKLIQIVVSEWKVFTAPVMKSAWCSFDATRPPLQAGKSYRFAAADAPLDGRGGVQVLMMTGRVSRSNWRRPRGCMRRIANRWTVMNLENVRVAKTVGAGEHAAAARPLDDLTGHVFTDEGERIHH